MNEKSYHYKVILRAINVLDAQGPAGADVPLSELAAQMGMSAAYFQRIFSQWVGVSPKRYQQYLTLNYARHLLAQRRSTLHTAHAAGLSGPGRLHDLMIRWEAMSPGEYAAGAKGLQIRWGWFDSPFGPALVMGTVRGICGLSFAAQMGQTDAMADLKSRWPHAQYHHDPAFLSAWVEHVFGTQGPADKETPVYLIGAPFQIKVWEALLRIPPGHVSTYSDIAAAIGRPGAMRAVGTAVGRNPIGWLLPCHRALRKSGALGGYHWGLELKRSMLAYESARLEAVT